MLAATFQHFQKGAVNCVKRHKSVVRIVEVGARDGLQNEKVFFPTHLKVEMINKLSETGISKIEASSYVNTKLIPQFIDSPEVMDTITRHKNVKYAALVPNLKGLKGAINGKADEVVIFAATNDVFSKNNINCTVDESFLRFKEVMALAKEHNIPVRGDLSCAFGCPFTGRIQPTRAAELARRMLDLGCFEVALADTIGVGVPETVEETIEACLKVCDVAQLAFHSHDTNGRSIDNITRAVEMGICVVDSSIGGLGGCPFGGPTITGNVATEKVVELLHKLGRLEKSIDREAIKNVANWVSDTLQSLKKPQAKSLAN